MSDKPVDWTEFVPQIEAQNKRILQVCAEVVTRLSKADHNPLEKVAALSAPVSGAGTKEGES